jgi:lambda repressor-like predicted transcriptional regulator
MERSETRRRTPNRRLMELRINKGLSPNDLGREALVSGKTVRLAEAGFIPGPRVQHAIAEVFELKPTDIWPLREQVRR